MNSCQKGKRGEREAAHAWRNAELGGARRGQQHTGLEGDDIVIEMEGVHVEVKRCESLSLFKAMEQSERDVGEGEIATVLHKRNRKDWLLVLKLEDVMELVSAVIMQKGRAANHRR
jgi:hypothetical protein